MEPPTSNVVVLEVSILAAVILGCVIALGVVCGFALFGWIVSGSIKNLGTRTETVCNNLGSKIETFCDNLEDFGKKIERASDKQDELAKSIVQSNQSVQLALARTR